MSAITVELIAVADVTLNRAQRSLSGPRGSIQPGPQLYALAERLMRRPAVLVLLPDLIAAPYPDADTEPDTSHVMLRNRVMLLRAALAILSSDGVRIRCEPGIGYAIHARWA